MVKSYNKKVKVGGEGEGEGYNKKDFEKQLKEYRQRLKNVTGMSDNQRQQAAKQPIDFGEKSTPTSTPTSTSQFEKISHNNRFEIYNSKIKSTRNQNETLTKKIESRESNLLAGLLQIAGNRNTKKLSTKKRNTNKRNTKNRNTKNRNTKKRK